MSDAPFFIVGCPRSGTTLLRVMLTSHPRLAVPPESHFVVSLAPPRREWPTGGGPALLDRVLEHPRFATWGVEAHDVRREVGRPPSGYADTIAAVYSAYARLQGKPRWGDKTPGYVSHLPLLAGLFPSARFVHIIRDGREVAASLVEFPWGPASAVSGAVWWRRKVGRGRRDGSRLGPERYLEVRLERLSVEPEAELRRVCAFLGEEFDADMLTYHERATFRARAVQNLSRPPTPNLRDWRAALAPRDQARVEAVCRPLLAELGYPDVPSRSASAEAGAWAQRARDLLRSGRRLARQRLRSGRDV